MDTLATSSDRSSAAAYPIQPDRALPTIAYRSVEALEVERRRVWQGGWVFVGTEDQVSEPGDYFTTMVGGQPVIVLRSRSGELAALSNLCAHRGTLLVDGPGTTKRFQCPYHAWTYRDDGSLLSVPFAGRDEVDKNEHCLPRYRCESWHGLVFVSMNNDVVSLVERFAHLEPIVAEHRLGDLKHWTSRREAQDWSANWKLVISNAMESYHLFKVHPETLEPYTPTKDAYYIVGNADGTATGGRQNGEEDYILLSLPPNFVGLISAGSLLYQYVEPTAIDRTRVIAGGAYTYNDPERSSGLTGLVTKAVSRAAGSLVPDFLPEDRWICERGQQAASGDFEPGRILAMEQVIVDFHHYLNRQLHGVAAPPVATAETVGIARPRTEGTLP
ncbi:MAG: aromatic ring-hydroxylating dioxygenase subunit alpha [Actinomycetota bacterium]